MATRDGCEDSGWGALGGDLEGLGGLGIQKTADEDGYRRGPRQRRHVLAVLDVSGMRICDRRELGDKMGLGESADER